MVACLVAWGILVTWSFRNIQGWLFRGDNTCSFVDTEKLRHCKTRVAQHAGALNTYLTPHVSFADFQSQNFGKVLSQLNDTRILGTEKKRLYEWTFPDSRSCFQSYFVKLFSWTRLISAMLSTASAITYYNCKNDILIVSAHIWDHDRGSRGIIQNEVKDERTGVAGSCQDLFWLVWYYTKLQVMWWNVWDNCSSNWNFKDKNEKARQWNRWLEWLFFPCQSW